MSKLAHNCDETMELIAAAEREREALGWDEPPLKEYPQREIFRSGGRYTQCQVLNWETGAPPKYLACHALDGTGDFVAAQRMGTWAEIDIHEVERRLNGTWPDLTARKQGFKEHDRSKAYAWTVGAWRRNDSHLFDGWRRLRC